MKKNREFENVTQIQKDLNLALSKVADELTQHLTSQNPSKSEQSDDLTKLYKLDLTRGIECYLQEGSSEEKKRFQDILDRLKLLANSGPLKKKKDYPLTDGDISFLDSLAARVLGEKKFKEASCMWRFIIQLIPFYDRAWVGWAISETELGHREIVAQIYQAGLEFLPNSVFLAKYASNFFCIEGKKDQARTLVQNTLKALHQGQERDVESIKVLEDQLSHL